MSVSITTHTPVPLMVSSLISILVFAIIYLRLQLSNIYFSKSQEKVLIDPGLHDEIHILNLLKEKPN